VGIKDYEDVTYRLFPGDITSARDGDYLAAARLMDLFQSTVEAGKPLAPELLRYFAEGFRQILAGADPALALHLKKPKGKPPDPEMWVRDGMLALAVKQLRDAGMMTYEEAIAKVSEDHHTSESTVRRAHDAWSTDVFAPEKKAGKRRKRTDTLKK